MLVRLVGRLSHASPPHSFLPPIGNACLWGEMNEVLCGDVVTMDGTG